MITADKSGTSTLSEHGSLLGSSALRDSTPTSTLSEHGCLLGCSTVRNLNPTSTISDLQYYQIHIFSLIPFDRFDGVTVLQVQWPQVLLFPKTSEALKRFN
jgi:hypothetical protein